MQLLKKRTWKLRTKNEKELNKTFKSYYGFDAKTIVKKDLLREKVLSYLVKNVVEQ